MIAYPDILEKHLAAERMVRDIVVVILRHFSDNGE
jgi:hypothetical protein